MKHPHGRPRARAWFLRLWFIAALVLFLAACGRKNLSTSDLRQVTSEIVASAQRVTQHKSDVAIRPEILPSPGAGPAQLAADHIYVTLATPAQATQLAQALDAIAHRHRLHLTETASGSVLRFDFSFEGIRTHTVHAVTPVAALVRPPAGPSSKNARLAIIIDDLGHDRSSADALLALPFPITASILPNLPFSSEVAEEAFRRGDQVLLHLPMESQAGGAMPEPVELKPGMTSAQVESTLGAMLASVPHAVGVNNHQGSLATADPALMAALMPQLRRRGLFFIDSRTTAATVAYDAAERAGVPAASRKVFLDDTPTREAVRAQLQLAARDARRDGAAIAIGHPHPATIAALTEAAPQLEARGILLVFASEIVR